MFASVAGGEFRYYATHDCMYFGGANRCNNEFRYVFSFTGGEDVTNVDLIFWLLIHATQVIEELPSSKETYFSIMSELAQTIAEKTGAELPLSIDEMIDALDNSSSDSNVSGYNVTLNRGSYAGFTDYITITYADGVVETYEKYNDTYLGITLSNVIKVQIYSSYGVELYSSTGSFTNTNGYTTTELSFDITEDSTTTITVDI